MAVAGNENQPPRRRYIVHDLYAVERDFQEYPSQPKKSLMLATTPRAGSTYCAIKLWQSGLGAPMEYLNFRSIMPLCRRLGFHVGEDGYIERSQVDAYWKAIQRLRTSPNGIFGYKMFPSNYGEIVRHYPDFLASITPHHVIYLERKDQLGQAISYARAQQTSVWFGDVVGKVAPTYDFLLIERCRRSLYDQRGFWMRTFEKVGVQPVIVTYEDLLAVPDATIAKVLNQLGLPSATHQALDIPCMPRQADDVSIEWRARFLDDAGGYASPEPSKSSMP